MYSHEAFTMSISIRQLYRQGATVAYRLALEDGIITNDEYLAIIRQHRHDLSKLQAWRREQAQNSPLRGNLGVRGTVQVITALSHV